MKPYESENVRLATENRQLKRVKRELFEELSRLFAAAEMGDAQLYNVVKHIERRWKEDVQGVV